MLTTEYGLTGSNRRPLVRVIEKALGIKAHCTRKPEFCYHFTDTIQLDNHGVLTIEDPQNHLELLVALDRAGYPTQHQQADSLCIALPREGFTADGIERLKQIIESKATILCKALEIEAVPIEVGEDNISFPWFSTIPAPRDLEAYVRLITRIAKLAQNADRVTGKDHEVENDRYYFRCFLLRLGMIGPEYKETRKILLRNLKGSSAFKYVEKPEHITEK